MDLTIYKSISYSTETGPKHLYVYPDRWLLIAGIPISGFLLRHIGEPEPLIELLSYKQYYFDLGFALVVISSIWLVNRLLIQQMDRQYSWATQTFQRFIIQAMLAYGFTFLFMLLVSFVYNELIVQRAAVFDINNVFSADIPTSLLFVTIIHLLYTGMWMINYHKHTIENLQQKLAYLQQQPGLQVEYVKEKEDNYKRTLVVNQGKGFVPLSTEQVAYIFIANELSLVKTMDSKTYSIDGSLEQLIGQLSPQDFFRISRQFIVQRKAIKKVESETSGRLLLHLLPEHTSEVTVSRRRAPDFRLWMEW
jgi:hypothetical protein